MRHRSGQTAAPGIDRRVARTRKLLEDALIALTLERGYAEVTVEDICQRANVGRSTFYAHHASKADLRRATIEGHLRSALGGASDRHASPEDRPFPFVRPLLEHVETHRAAHRAVAREHTIHDEVVDGLRAKIREALTAGPLRPAEIPVDFAAEFLTGAFQQILHWWLQSRRPDSPEEIERLFSRMAAGSRAAGRGTG